MGLKVCKECGAPVAWCAKACPQCGAYKPGRRWWDLPVGILLITVLLYILSLLLAGLNAVMTFIQG